MSSDRNLPNLSSPGVDDQQTLRNQPIDERGPGTVLADFETLLGFVEQDGIPVSGMHELLPMKSLTQLNALLTHPIETGLKRPQQKSYPHINGLYLLLRATGLATVASARTGRLLLLDNAALQSWRNLNSTERYFTLLETWLLRSRPGIVGEHGGLLDIPIIKWVEFFRRIPAQGLAIVGNKDQEFLITYSPGWHTLALLDLFGFILAQEDKLGEGKGWRVARVCRTPFGDAMLQLLSDLLLSDEYLGRYHRDTDVPFGELQTIVQPLFPQWRQNLSLPELQFQDGTYIFKVSLGKRVWRRIAIPGTADFESLSSSILRAFAFDDDHLYRFTYKNRFGVLAHINHPYMDEPPFTSEVQIGEIGIRPGTTMTYLYDFGDNWQFEVQLEGIDPADPKVRRPNFLESHGEAPEQYPPWDE